MHNWVIQKQEEVVQAYIDWCKMPSPRKLRAGQYIYNKCAPSGSPPWPELFYEENQHKVVKMLVNYMESA